MNSWGASSLKIFVKTEHINTPTGAVRKLRRHLSKHISTLSKQARYLYIDSSVRTDQQINTFSKHDQGQLKSLIFVEIRPHILTHAATGFGQGRHENQCSSGHMQHRLEEVQDFTTITSISTTSYANTRCKAIIIQVVLLYECGNTACNEHVNICFVRL